MTSSMAVALLLAGVTGGFCVTVLLGGLLGMALAIKGRGEGSGDR
ncbi:hypothetical protein [Halomonas sp.]|nr:hypothetical protein [Halomonas sp.]